MVEFLDHLGLAQVTVVGTSRGGLIAMLLAATAHDRLAGVLLNDIGPELAPEGLANIMTYLGVPPKARTLRRGGRRRCEARMGARFPGLADAKLAEPRAALVRRGRRTGSALNYDPRIRDASRRPPARPAADMWPLFDALAGRAGGGGARRELRPADRARPWRRCGRGGRT